MIITLEMIKTGQKMMKTLTKWWFYRKKLRHTRQW